MKNLFLILIALLLLQTTSAQDWEVQISSNVLDNEEIEIHYEKTKPGNFTVALKFTNLTNTLQSNESVMTVDSNNGILLTLKPRNKNQGISYRGLDYRYIRGKLNPKFNEEFCYTIPYKVGKKVRVLESEYLNVKYFGAEELSDWKSYSFITDLPDTVTAIRKGVVVDIVDKYEDKNSENIAYTSERNQIIVEHEDGTLLRYLGFKGGSIMVQLGEGVLPGSVLGINSLTQNSNYSIDLLLYYLNSANFESQQSQTLSNPKSVYKVLTPKFALEGSTCILIENRNEYIVYNNEEIITREMSKKELKKYNNTINN